jgi:hypothetical protein
VNIKNNPEKRVALAKSMFTGYVGVSGLAATLFVGELADAFPDAKVVVTTICPNAYMRGRFNGNVIPYIGTNSEKLAFAMHRNLTQLKKIEDASIAK